MICMTNMYVHVSREVLGGRIPKEVGEGGAEEDAKLHIHIMEMFILI